MGNELVSYKYTSSHISPASQGQPTLTNAFRIWRWNTMALPLSVSFPGVFPRKHTVYAAMCNTSCAFVASPEIIRIKNFSHSVCATDAQRSSHGFQYDWWLNGSSISFPFKLRRLAGIPENISGTLQTEL